MMLNNHRAQRNSPEHGDVVPSFALRILLGVFILLAFAGIPSQARAEADSPPAAEFREPDAAAKPPQLVGIAIYLLMTVTILSGSLLILLMLWGVRVRRQVRKPLPSVKPNDPLWYLKSKNPPIREPQGPATVADPSQPIDKPSDDSSFG